MGNRARLIPWDTAFRQLPTVSASRSDVRLDLAQIGHWTVEAPVSALRSRAGGRLEVFPDRCAELGQVLAQGVLGLPEELRMSEAAEAWYDTAAQQIVAQQPITPPDGYLTYPPEPPAKPVKLRSRRKSSAAAKPEDSDPATEQPA
jgi:hypothetical protein